MRGEVSNPLIGAAIEVHRVLGPGLLESTYEECLCHELALRGLAFERQVPIALEYKGLVLPDRYRVDLIVEDLAIVELKAVENVLPIHEAQLLTYMRLARKRLGLLINFKEARLRDGITRRVL